MNIVLPILALGALAASLYLQPTWLVRILARLNPEVLFSVDTMAPKFALTIDDGPHPEVTPALLDVLKKHGARATFFVMGDRGRSHPELLARIVAEGHEVANHLITEQNSIGLPAGQFESELLSVDQLLTPFNPQRWFRPGSGWFRKDMLAIARKHGYSCVLGSLYPFDAHIHWPSVLTAHLKLRVAPGKIVILHEGTVERRLVVMVLDQVLDSLNRRGLLAVTVTELVESAVSLVPLPALERRREGS